MIKRDAVGKLVARQESEMAMFPVKVMVKPETETANSKRGLLHQLLHPMISRTNSSPPAGHPCKQLFAHPSVAKHSINHELLHWWLPCDP